MSEITCPNCKGERKVYRQAIPTIYAGWVDCETCKGVGTITEEKQALLEIGNDIRRKRRRLHILPDDFAHEFGFPVKLWELVERGESTLEYAYKARTVIENLSVQFKDKFDVVFWQSATKSEKVGTFSSKEDAEKRVAAIKEKLRSVGAGGYCQIIERKERVVL